MINNEPWHINPQVYQTLQNTPQKSGYTLIDGASDDYQTVTTLYQKSPIKGYIIGKIQIINNPALTRQFEGKVMVLHERANSPAFNAKWDQENDLPVRQLVNQALGQITIQNKSTYHNVQFYPAFHGTKSTLIDSILKTGFANLATTDNGFFGKGLYNTQYAEYAHRVYSDGTLLFNWVAFYSAYPVTLSDMPKLQGSANYSNYDAHYVLVAPKDPQNPNEVIYYPITQFQNPTYDELVVFDSSHILPRYLITLTPDLIRLQNLSLQATGVTLMTAISSYFPEAATSTLQELLQKELVALSSQLMTPLNFNQLSLLTLVERSKGETDPAIKLHLANKITKLLEDTVSIPPSPPNLTQSAFPQLQYPPNINLPEQKQEIGTQQTLLNSTPLISGLPQWLLNSNLPPQNQTSSINHSLTTTEPKLPPRSRSNAKRPEMNEIRTMRTEESKLLHLAKLPDGNLTSISNDLNTTIEVWDPKTGKRLKKTRQWCQGMGASFYSTTVLLADGNFAHGTVDKIIRIFNPKTGKCIKILEGHKSSISNLTQLADGSLASGSDDDTIKIWNLKDSFMSWFDPCLLTLKVGSSISSLTQLRDENLASGGSEIKIWNLKEGLTSWFVDPCLLTLEGHTYSVSSLKQLADGSLASGSKNEIKIWDLNAGKCTQTLTGHNNDHIITLEQLANSTLASGSENAIKIWDLKSGKCIQDLPVYDKVLTLLPLANGNLAAGFKKGTIKIWE
jgi:WD40 repeat protein